MATCIGASPHGSVRVFGQHRLTPEGDLQDVTYPYIVNASRIFSTGHAYATIQSDGTVKAFGPSAYGGDSSSVSGPELTDVVEMESTQSAFAVLHSDQSVSTWGNALEGGDSAAVQASLTGVASLHGNKAAFV